MKDFELLVFDWDGTLSDSAAHIVASMQGAILELGLPLRDDAAVRDLIGLGLTDGMRLLYPELDTEGVLELLAGYRRRFFSPGAMVESPLFDGVLETLQGLAEQGYLLAVATGKSRRGLDRALAHHHPLGGCFIATRTADETASKPDPLMLRELLVELDVPPHKALMIGDTEYDAQMARSLTVPMLGVACGVHEPQRLLAAGACAVLERVAELPDWFSQRS